ncbi:MAG: ribosome small subunit-dependent GTPase A [Cyclobacteriaceae bacterium]|nr:ribosome small subunit-dependent GTPase A [Cyclobacteriaceae bacterium]
MEGLVIKSTGSWYEVKTSEGKIIRCRVRGKLKIKGLKVTNPVSVGDHVQYDLEDNGQGIIHSILPRTNYLIRRSTRKTAFGHILACNIDLAVVIATISFPRTSLGFIDRFLVAAESFRIPSLLVFNKTDMWGNEEREYANELQILYKKVNVDFLIMSATSGYNLDLFRERLLGKISLIAGHSGVGKSTILNLFSPKINQKTAEVSTFANKGIHTTTFAEMFEIDNDTYVIDTPGIKELGLMDIYNEEISHFFPEMRDLFGKCKFHNCTHTHEPNCAVMDAVENGEIAMSRFESYLSMMEGFDSHR